MERDELAAWLRLGRTQGVGNLLARKLLAAFGLPQQVFDQSTTALCNIVSPAQAKALHRSPDGLPELTQATMDWLQGGESGGKSGVWRGIVTLADALYPHSLLAMEDPPLMLYVTGSQHLYAQLASKNVANDIAIVGSRNPTPQGVTNARSFAKSFAQSGLHVVSGLALGIDGAAHLGVLDAWDEPGAIDDGSLGSTIAIVGTGLDRVYPKRHHELAHRICEHGIIMSEFAIGTPPLQHNFPSRNRIIAALTQGTLVVEAALQSGSLITARLATEQGKDVFAIPGSIHSTLSKGCHHLIKQGAKLVESAQDVLEELNYPGATKLVAAYALSAGSSADFGNEMADEGAAPEDSATSLLGALGYDPVSLDALIDRTGMDAATLQAKLMQLELDNQVVRLPGGLFQRYLAA